MSNMQGPHRVTVQRIGDELRIQLPARQLGAWLPAITLIPLLIPPAVLVVALIKGSADLMIWAVFSTVALLAIAPMLSLIAFLAWNNTRCSSLLILSPTTLTRSRQMRLFNRSYSWNRRSITDIRVRMANLIEIASGIIGPAIDLRTSESLVIWRLLDRRWTTLTQGEMEWIGNLLRHELGL